MGESHTGQHGKSVCAGWLGPTWLLTRCLGPEIMLAVRLDNTPCGKRMGTFDLPQNIDIIIEKKTLKCESINGPSKEGDTLGIQRSYTLPYLNSRGWMRVFHSYTHLLLEWRVCSPRLSSLWSGIEQELHYGQIHLHGGCSYKSWGAMVLHFGHK